MGNDHTNSERWKILGEKYNPLTGEGSKVARIPIHLTDSMVIHVPFTMEDEGSVRLIQSEGNLARASRKAKVDEQLALHAFTKLRLRHDFEFWSATCVNIQTKEKGIQRFILNNPQRKLLNVMEAMRIRGVPIRVILLKARQWGGSTLVQLYMAWIQLFHRTNWNAMVVSALKDQALHIRGMYQRMADGHPTGLIEGADRVILNRYMQTSNIKVVAGRECIIGVGSVQEPDSIRSYTTHMLHLSEVGLWKSTPTINAENLIATMEGGLVTAPYTVCVKESTARGVGNFFHRDWQKAEKGESLDVPVFVSWFESEKDYFKTVPDVSAFLREYLNPENPNNEYWRYLWKLGATAEHIAWYMDKRKGMSDKWRLMNEFPSTAAEAFQSTGERVFPQEYVLKVRSNVREPIVIGNLSGKASKGPDAFKDITFEESKSGLVKIWNYPGKLGKEVAGKRYTNRYCAFADVGGTHAKADYSCLVVLDRFFTRKGGVPIVAAEFHGHMDHDLFAWYAARLCWWYEKAHLAIEVNSLINDHGDAQRGYDSDHSLTILDEIKDFYPNLYFRENIESAKGLWTAKYGFHTNASTKPMIIDSLRAAMREDGYEERDRGACDEFDWYEKKPDGKLGAVEGQHDDKVIARAGAVWLSGQMPPVQEVDIQKERVGTGKEGGFAQF